MTALAFWQPKVTAKETWQKHRSENTADMVN